MDEKPSIQDWAEIKFVSGATNPFCPVALSGAELDILLQIKEGKTSIWTLWGQHATRWYDDKGRRHFEASEWLRNVTRAWSYWRKQVTRYNQPGEHTTMDIFKQPYPEKVDHITLAQMKPGKPFRHPDGADLYIRVDESLSTAKDYMSGPHIRAVNIKSGAVYIYPISKSVVPVEAKVIQGRDLLPHIYVQDTPAYMHYTPTRWPGVEHRRQHRRFQRGDRRKA